MPFITHDETDYKPLLIVIILAVISCGILVYQYRLAQEEEILPQIINTNKNNPYSCFSDEDCFSSCMCGCINRNKTCPGDELVECDGYPCRCSDNKCIKKEEDTLKGTFEENISSCVSPANFSYQLYIKFNSSVTLSEAQNVLKTVDAYDINPKSGNTYYFHIPDGKICIGIAQLKKSDKVSTVDSVPWMPTAP